MNEKIWRVKNKVDGVILDDHFWGSVRFIFIMVFTFFFIGWGFRLFENVDTSAIEEIIHKDGYFIFSKNLMIVWVRFTNNIIYGFRHAIIPVSMFIGILLASAFYVQNLYELSSFGSAFRHIFASFVGSSYPKVTIKDGEYQVKKGEINLLDAIGGPGYLNIRPGSIAFVESLRSPPEVLSSGYHFLSRFDTVRDIVNLDDQHGFIEELQTKVRTKDGILIVVRDVHYRYRLRTGRRFGDHEKRRAQNPYPYSVQAVKDMAYNRSVGTRGLTSWHATIQLAVDGAITDYIKAHNFDQLTAPGQEDDPRAEISQKLMSGAVRTRLKNWGAEMLWFDIGHFDVIEEIVDPKSERTIKMKEAIEKHRINTWSARWDGNAMVIRAAGEGQRMVANDIGRAEGQADMLMSIIEALKEVEISSDHKEDDKKRAEILRSIVWTQVAQVLDRIADEEKKSSK